MFINKNINWAIANQILVSAVNFITGILIARLLGLDIFGQFTLLWLATLFLSNIQEALLLSPMVSIVPKLTTEEAKRYLNGTIYLSITYSAIVILLLILFFQFMTIEVPLPFSFFFATLFFLIQNMYSRYFYAIQSSKLAFFNDAINYLGQIIILPSLMYFYGNLTLNGIFISLGFSSFCATIFSFVVTKTKLYKKHGLRNMFNTWKRNWNISKWMLSSVLANWLSSNLFILAAGFYLGTIAVGALKSAQNILGISHILFKVIENIVPTKASELLSKKNTKAMLNYLKKITQLSSLSFTCLVIIILLFRDELMTLIYGAEFTQYSWLLIGFSCIYFFMLLAFPLRILLRTIENTKYIFYAFLASALFTLMTIQQFVLTMGMTGVILGMLTGSIITVVVLGIYAQKRLRIYNHNAKIKVVDI